MATVEPGPRIGDAFGLSLLDYLEHGADARDQFIERDDGLVEIADQGVYFDQESEWSVAEATVNDRAGRRVLDIGSGAGRHSLALQSSGREVVALDVSAAALEVCRRRGVSQTFEGSVFDLVETGPQPFDTFLLCGNNFGLLESFQHAPRFLGALRALAVSGAEVIGTCIDPLTTVDPLHLAYHDLNRSRARHPGQLSLRARWADMATPWFDYLFVPVGELAELASTAGWELVEHEPGPRPYLAVLRLRT